MAAVLIAAAVAAGCSPSPLPPEPVIETTDQFVAALRQSGQTVDETEILGSVGELVGGRVYFLDGARLDVFEYETGRAGESAARSLTRPAAAGAPTPEEPLVAWAKARLIVVYRGSDGGVIALLNGLLGDPLTLPHDVVNEPYPPGVATAIAFLAQDLEADPGRIVVVGYQATDWPDACLGLGGPSETCAAVVTKGWRIELRLDSASYVVRSDEFGQVIRRE